MNGKELQEYIEKRMQETGIEDPTLEELDTFLTEFMQSKNSHPLECFEGYSPLEMRYILYNLLGVDCPVQLTGFTNEDCNSVPLFRQVKMLLELIEKEENLKLTQAGNLPVQVVKEIYFAGVSDPHIESGLIKLRLEKECISVQMAKIAVQSMKAVKKRNNKLSLTKKGKKLLANNHNLLVELLTVMLGTFNTAYFDGYSSENIGVMGIGFSLILLHKYGGTDRLDAFYSDKYFNAFPILYEEATESYIPHNEAASYCYSIRVFDVLFYHLGLVTIVETDKWHKKLIHRTNLFDRLFKIVPPETLST